MYSFYDVSKQNLSQKVIIPEIGVGMIPIVVSPLNAKKVTMKLLYVIKHMLKIYNFIVFFMYHHILFKFSINSKI